MMKCKSCLSRKLRLSRMRRADVLPLLSFQLPLRCRSCGLRFHRSIFFAMLHYQKYRSQRVQVLLQETRRA